ncbi:MAG: hypothetical protein H7326_08315, partial [Bdellovibrionaceae bacterium]|nr:hypothetical protein [Pseudobdellovibrionaceae bacterium]
KSLRLQVNDRVNGGSLKFYSVNPSIIDSEVYAKFKFTRALSMAVGAGTTISGASMAAGFHVGVNFGFAWDSQPSYYLKPGGSGTSTNEDDLSSERKVPRFKEETNDGVDQKIFEKKGTPTPRNKPRSSNELVPAEDGVAMKKAPKNDNAPVIEEDSSGGEVQLKLKRKKKRRS